MNKILSGTLVLLSLVATNCRKQTTASSSPYHPPVITAANIRYLALGDSYTIGQSVAADQRFPAQTVSILKSMGVAMRDPDYIATTGWTTNDLATAISSTQPDSSYNLVTLLIGVNDQYQTHDTTGYRTRFLNLLNTAVALAKGIREHVVVVSIPDYSVTPFAANADTAFIRGQINMFNAINLEVTNERHCLYLDITPSTREALADPTLVATDGLHPSGKEYEKWAQSLSQMTYSFLK